MFIAPSAFLAERYRHWGLDGDKIVVLENGHPPVEEQEIEANHIQASFGFFGQINPFKGLHVLLEAVTLLPKSVRKRIHVDIHGANLELQAPEFREKIGLLVEKAGRAVTLHGPYERSQLGTLMLACGWVVVPSIWWENSPMVIQEAFLHDRPVVCSDIGGMAEKVRHDVDGLHFRARSARSLAMVMERAVTEQGIWERLRQGIQRPPTVSQWVDRQLDLVAGI